MDNQNENDTSNLKTRKCEVILKTKFQVNSEKTAEISVGKLNMILYEVRTNSLFIDKKKINEYLNLNESTNSNNNMNQILDEFIDTINITSEYSSFDLKSNYIKYFQTIHNMNNILNNLVLFSMKIQFLDYFYMEVKKSNSISKMNGCEKLQRKLFYILTLLFDILSEHKYKSDMYHGYIVNELISNNIHKNAIIKALNIYCEVIFHLL
jgi:hypothetical protein